MKTAEEHETCDGCKFFQDCGCMLDDSCPPCFEHSSWTPKKSTKKKREMKTEEEYTPYGEEWKNELMKMPKIMIINMYRNVCLELEETNKLLEQAENTITIMNIAGKGEQCKAYKELVEAQEELISCLEREISIASFDGCDLDQHLVACYNTETAQKKITELKQLINDK
jgi:hypothetical protein